MPEMHTFTFKQYVSRRTHEVTHMVQYLRLNKQRASCFEYPFSGCENMNLNVQFTEIIQTFGCKIQ